MTAKLTEEQARVFAAALIDQIASLLKADAEADNRAAVEAERADCTDELRLAVAAAVEAEREAWVAAIEHYFDATAVMDVEVYAAAIRARAGKGE